MYKFPSNVFFGYVQKQKVVHKQITILDMIQV